jgi:hypothetical protein
MVKTMRDGQMVELTPEEVSHREERKTINTAFAVKIKEIMNEEDKAKAQAEIDKASGNQKLKDLGLTDAEIKALTAGTGH